jgi:hypothetical protein
LPQQLPKNSVLKETQTMLKERANRGSREKFLAALEAVPNVAPDAEDAFNN